MIRERGFDAVLADAIQLESKRLKCSVDSIRARAEAGSGPAPWVEERRKSAYVSKLLRRFLRHHIRETRKVSSFSCSSIWRLKKLSTTSRVHCGESCDCVGKLKSLMSRRGITIPTESTSPPANTQAGGDEVVLLYAQRDLLAVRALFLQMYSAIFGSLIPFAFRHTDERPSVSVLGAAVAIDLMDEH